MNKEEVLEKSRRENNNRDIYENEVLREGGNIGAIVAAILAAIFFIVQIMLGGGQNYGLFAVVFSIPAASFVVKAVRLRRKHEIAIAILYVFTTLAFSLAHIWQLVKASMIL